MRPVDAVALKEAINEYITSREDCPLHIAAEIDQYIDEAPTISTLISND